MKVVINTCYGGFGLSEAAYEKLIEWGVPVRRYIEQKRDPQTGLWHPEPLNDGEVIFDRELSPPEQSPLSALYHKYKGTSADQGRYWDAWFQYNRSHPLLVRVVEELGDEANGQHAGLTIVEIPDDVEFTIEEHDGNEHVAEAHRTWR